MVMKVPGYAVKVWCRDKKEALNLLNALAQEGLRWRSGRTAADPYPIRYMPDDFGIGVFIESAFQPPNKARCRVSVAASRAFYEAQRGYYPWEVCIEDEIDPTAVVKEVWI